MTAPTIGEVTGIVSSREALRETAARATTFLDGADAAIQAAKGMRAESETIAHAAETMRATMASEEVDDETLGEVSALQERASALAAAAAQLEEGAYGVKNAADGLEAAADTALAGMNARHSGVEEAHKAAPNQGATKKFYTDG